MRYELTVSRQGIELTREAFPDRASAIAAYLEQVRLIGDLAGREPLQATLEARDVKIASAYPYRLKLARVEP